MATHIKTKQYYGVAFTTMSSKSIKVTRNICDRHTSSSNFAKTKVPSKVVIPRKILISKKLTKEDGKSGSAGVINRTPTKINKTVKSDSFCNQTSKPFDFCKKCGDSTQSNEGKNKSIHKIDTNLSNTKTTRNNRSKSVEQYYLNKNFGLSTESMHETVNRKKSLDTIKEIPEIRTISDDAIFKIYQDSESENGFLDVDDDDVIKDIKTFRQNNYFECHSAKSRIKSEVRATTLGNHQCVYRFYLNDRLFPIPLNTDYNNRVRCVECHLPMELKLRDNNKINGTIQAKVKLGEELKDTMLLLPAKEPLIIKEKRTEDRTNLEEVYFGVIKLDFSGNSMFRRTLPDNSLALKYQKGYKEFVGKKEDCYKGMDQDDIIYI